jgi:hypothetical protein
MLRKRAVRVRERVVAAGGDGEHRRVVVAHGRDCRVRREAEHLGGLLRSADLAVGPAEHERDADTDGKSGEPPSSARPVLDLGALRPCSVMATGCARSSVVSTSWP